jgi:tetratricopeptide (TPR) repeat protein
VALRTDAADVAAAIPAPAPPQREPNPELASDSPAEDAPNEPKMPGSTPVQWATRSPAQQRRLNLVLDTLKHDPDNEPALRDGVAAAAELEQWRVAEILLQRLSTVCPDDVAVRFEYAGLLMRSRRFVAASEVLESVVADRPDDARAWYNLATAHQAVGRLSAARRAWTRVIELAAETDAYARRAEVLLDQHEWAAAIRDLEMVLAAEPDATDAALNLALANERMGNVTEARALLLSIVERHPRYLPALNRLAGLAMQDCETLPTGKAGACEDVAEWCRQSLAIDPNQPDVQALLAAARERMSGPAASVE